MRTMTSPAFGPPRSTLSMRRGATGFPGNSRSRLHPVELRACAIAPMEDQQLTCQNLGPTHAAPGRGRAAWSDARISSRKHALHRLATPPVAECVTRARSKCGSYHVSNPTQSATNLALLAGQSAPRAVITAVVTVCAKATERRPGPAPAPGRQRSFRSLLPRLAPCDGRPPRRTGRRRPVFLRGVIGTSLAGIQPGCKGAVDPVLNVKNEPELATEGVVV